jgi:hypothetical protein
VIDGEFSARKILDDGDQSSIKASISEHPSVSVAGGLGGALSVRVVSVLAILGIPVSEGGAGGYMHMATVSANTIMGHHHAAMGREDNGFITSRITVKQLPNQYILRAMISEGESICPRPRGQS